MPIIDYVAGYEISELDGINELATLNCLATGLEKLVQEVRVLEQPIQIYERNNRKKNFFFGSGFNLPIGAEQLLPCYFHWFGTSVCNYARLTGFLSGIATGVFSRNASLDTANYGLIKKHCDSYVDSISELEPIKVWRNKVFAHFAMTDPRPKDNAALLDASVMSPIGYFDGRFRVGGMVIGSSGADVEMPPWSVTESFELLASRFWPNRNL